MANVEEEFGMKKTEDDKQEGIRQIEKSLTILKEESRSLNGYAAGKRRDKYIIRWSIHKKIHGHEIRDLQINKIEKRGYHEKLFHNGVKMASS